jgi:S-DNA-T family DNA segregation ATPase FtsK/SpoIIIE
MKYSWTPPDVGLLKSISPEVDTPALGALVEKTFRDLGVQCAAQRVVVGPTTTRVELTTDPGVPLRDFTKLERASDLAYWLGAESVRIEAPIPGRSAVGVELSNAERRQVSLGDVCRHVRAPLTCALGLDGDNYVVTLDIARAPHLLIAGVTGGGKSVLLRTLLCGLLMRAGPDQLGIVLCDPKGTELAVFEGLPHLYGAPAVEVDSCISSLWWAVAEMDARYRLLHRYKARDLDEYNESTPEGYVPRALVVVDELGDLMMRSRKEVESAIVRIGQKGRAAGVHMVLATQSPKREVVTGLIRANLPARIGLRTSTAIDSRIVLERSGCEALLGEGDALLDSGKSSALTRFQSAYTPTETIKEIVEAWKIQAPTEEEVAA